MVDSILLIDAASSAEHCILRLVESCPLHSFIFQLFFQKLLGLRTYDRPILECSVGSRYVRV